MNTGTFHGVLVDPGNGKVLASNPFPFSALGMIFGQGMMGPGMMGPGMMGPGMMKGPGIMRGNP
jgi:spore coat protein D